MIDGLSAGLNRSSRGKAAIGAVLLWGLLLGQPALADSNTPAEPPFDIQEYRVLGNSVLQPRDIETAVYPYLGPGKTLRDVESARHALESVYHDRGYGTVFVDIPEQEVNDGIVRLRVSEGKVRRTQVAGARYFSGRQIRAAVPDANAGSVPNLPALQQELTQLNTQTPDRSVVPVLKAGPTPGTVDLALKVDDHLPLHASVETNNQYTPDTRPLRALFSLSYDDLFGRLDSLSLQYQVAPQQPDQVSVMAASYTMHVNDEGRRWSLIFIDSNSNVATLGALSVVGKGKIYGTRLTEPLTFTSLSSQSLIAELDYKDFAQSIQVDTTNTVQTPVSYLHFSGGYVGAWHTQRFQWTFDTSANFGVRGLASHTQQFADKRYLASPNYLYLRSDASFGMHLPWDLTAIARLGGQYSADPLISNEQITIGGVQSVRGYLEAEELGDIGGHASFQLGSPQWKLLESRMRLDAFAFYDFARVSTLNPLPNEVPNTELRSLGLGFNFNSFDHVTGTFTWAYPLADASRTHAHASRLLFSVQSSW